jgi:hypothetical protein
MKNITMEYAFDDSDLPDFNDDDWPIGFTQAVGPMTHTNLDIRRAKLNGCGGKI